MRLPGLISSGEALSLTKDFTAIKDAVYNYLDASKEKGIEFTVIPRSTRCFAILNKEAIDGGCKILFEWGAVAEARTLTIAVYAHNNPKTPEGRATLKELAGINRVLDMNEYKDQAEFFKDFTDCADSVVSTLLARAYK